ncbi:hypothetical protein [Nioella nitratireducens]|uniref:hypothetical protein n=1 Tax=Nioella nitratireducens TaxID=1287720 RepID=UPI0008FCE734|nr:hypothetical protein [Nioella nitratireducens]
MATKASTTKEAWQHMNETTDLDRIAALEHRITTALDRIAQGIASRADPAAADGSAPPTEDLEDRVASLTAALEETQSALQAEQAANADLTDRLHALEAARQADADDAARTTAALRDELEAATSASAEADAAAQAELEAELERQREIEAVLRRRIVRVRDERKAARAEYNEAREQLEEVQGKLDQLQGLADSSGPEATGELARLRESNRSLRDTVDEMREAIAAGDAPDSDLVTAALAAELESLRAERASEAAEARAILSEIRPVLEGGAADA